MTLHIALARARATGGGTALPIIRAPSSRLPKNTKLSGKPCNRAPSRRVMERSSVG